MECELNDKKIKYEEGKLWKWREIWGKHKLKVPHWVEMKGCVNKGTGYRYVKINNKRYAYHRVVYFIHNQEWNIHNSSMDNMIDHIDQDRLNNNIENLRVVTHQQNQWNRDCKGYTFRKATGKYRARIRADGKQKYLGSFVSEEDAMNAYLEAKAEYHLF
tara:strand:+ start:599 stop:1078 length:480 start_codon:yes stop_codon:yes gene_type:complete